MATFGVFGPTALAILNSWLSGKSFRMVLVTASYTPNQAEHDTWSDISTNEVANGNGYATHGKAVTLSATRAGLVATLDSTDPAAWTSSTITAKYPVIVHDANADGALAGTDVLVGLADLNFGGGSLSSTNGNFTVTVNASGLLTLTSVAIA